MFQLYIPKVLVVTLALFAAKAELYIKQASSARVLDFI